MSRERKIEGYIPFEIEIIEIMKLKSEIEDYIPFYLVLT